MLLLLLSSMLSIDRQTDEETVGIGSEDFLYSPEMNRSILFSMYLLRMTKKMNHFLRNFVRRERMFPWFNINPSPLVFFLVGETEETSSVKSHALTIRTGLRLSRVPVVPQHLLRGRNHVTGAWRGATVEK